MITIVVCNVVLFAINLRELSRLNRQPRLEKSREMNINVVSLTSTGSKTPVGYRERLKTHLFTLTAIEQ